MTCVNSITNGAPLVVFRGTNDLSDRDVAIEAVPRPQHLPVFVLQTERGPLTPQIVFGGMRDLMYGSSSFTETGPYTNHQTIGANIVQSAANAAVIFRVSNGTRANLTLWLEVTEADIPLYQRDAATGKYVLNTLTGALIPIVGQSTPGYTLRWLVTSDATVGTLGDKLTSVTTNGAGDTVTRYPILQMPIENQGVFGNNVGIRLFANTSVGAVDTVDLLRNRAFPYQFMMMDRVDANSSPKPIPTLTGERATTVTFSPTATSRTTRQSTYLKDVANERFSNTTDTRYRLAYSPFGGDTYLYQANIETIAANVMASELAYLTANPTAISNVNPDDMTVTGSHHMMNLVSARDHGDIPYYSVTLDETTTAGLSVRLTPFTTVYAQNGMDNVMSVADYEAAVVGIMTRYADCADPLQDVAIRPESIFYDTGFSLDTKLDLAQFISVRPDLNLVYSTHTDDRQVRGFVDLTPLNPQPLGSSRTLTMVEENAIASTLQARVRLIPESEYFGTPTCDAIIFAGSGVIRNSQWAARVPITMEMMYKASRYMGAANGKWTSGERFSRAPGNVFTMLTDVSIPWVPADIRVRNWDAGINMALSYNEQFKSMPTLQTVYSDDTSILNQWLPTLAISYLNKIAHAAWREFRGSDDLEPGELTTAVNAFVADKVTGIWDDRFLVVPNATVTTDDELRGTTWHLDVKFGATNARTTEIVSISAYRRADLEALLGGTQ